MSFLSTSVKDFNKNDAINRYQCYCCGQNVTLTSEERLEWQKLLHTNK